MKDEATELRRNGEWKCFCMNMPTMGQVVQGSKTSGRSELRVLFLARRL